MRVLCIYLGIATIPRSISQRSATCAADLPYCGAYSFFITIRLSGINHHVTDLKRIPHTSFRFVWWNLKDSVTQNRHLYAVVQFDRLHDDSCFYAAKVHLFSEMDKKKC